VPRSGARVVLYRQAGQSTRVETEHTIVGGARRFLRRNAPHQPIFSGCLHHHENDDRLFPRPGQRRSDHANTMDRPVNRSPCKSGKPPRHAQCRGRLQCGMCRC
jgi:hypothetical protein